MKEEPFAHDVYCQYQVNVQYAYCSSYFCCNLNIDRFYMYLGFIGCMEFSQSVSQKILEWSR